VNEEVIDSSKAKPSDDPQHLRERLRAKWIEAVLVFVQLLIFAILLVGHVGLERLIVLAMGKEHPGFKAFLENTTMAAIGFGYLAVSWEMLLLFLPSFTRHKR